MGVAPGAALGVAMLAFAALLAGAHADPAIVPDPTLTPGAVRTTDVAAICSTPTRELRHRGHEGVMMAYGLTPNSWADYELDHLIPLGIGGADDDRNLWPEPRRSIEPVWNAERKDQLESRLRELICSGSLDAREAQKAITDDWTAAYNRFVAPQR